MDYLYSVFSGLYKRLQDMGDGTHAEVIAVAPSTIVTIGMFTAATAPGVGPARAGVSNNKTFQAAGSTSSGVGAASVQVEGSLDGNSWDLIGTISLTLGTTTTSDSFTSMDRYTLLRGRVASISGAGAAVSLWMAR